MIGGNNIQSQLYASPEVLPEAGLFMLFSSHNKHEAGVFILNIIVDRDVSYRHLANISFSLYVEIYLLEKDTHLRTIGNSNSLLILFVCHKKEKQLSSTW